MGDLACVEGVPKPWGDQWGLGDEEGRVQGVVGPVEGVEDPEEDRNLEEGGLGAWVPLEADRTDQERGQGEAVYRHGLEDQGGEGGGLDQGVEVLEGLGGQVGQEGGVGDPASHLCRASSRSCPLTGRD